MKHDISQFNRISTATSWFGIHLLIWPLLMWNIKTGGQSVCPVLNHTLFREEIRQNLWYPQWKIHSGEIKRVQHAYGNLNDLGDENILLFCLIAHPGEGMTSINYIRWRFLIWERFKTIEEHFWALFYIGRVDFSFRIKSQIWIFRELITLWSSCIFYHGNLNASPLIEFFLF